MGGREFLNLEYHVYGEPAFVVDYAFGKGSFSVNVEESLRAWSRADFKKFVSVFEMSADPYETATRFFDILCRRAAWLDYKVKDADLRRDEFSKKNYISMMEKNRDFLQIMSEKFGFSIPESVQGTIPEKTKTKKAEFYTHIFKGEKIVQSFSGWIFKKDGVYFGVKKRNQFEYDLILLCCGFSVATKGTKKEAIAEVDEVLKKLKTMKNAIIRARVDFLNTAEKCNVELNEDFYCLPDFVLEESARKESTPAVKESTQESVRESRKESARESKQERSTAGTMKKRLLFVGLRRSQNKAVSVSRGVFIVGRKTSPICAHMTPSQGDYCGVSPESCFWESVNPSHGSCKFPLFGFSPVLKVRGPTKSEEIMASLGG